MGVERRKSALSLSSSPSNFSKSIVNSELT